MSVETVLWIMAVLVYLWVSWFFLRGNQLSGVHKWIFSLTVVPVFALLVSASLWLADRLVPGTLAWIASGWQRLSAQDWSAFEGYVDNRPHSGAVLAGVLAVPVLLCWAWHALAAGLSRRRRNRSAPVLSARANRARRMRRSA